MSICNYIDENNSNLAKVKSFFFQVRPVGRAGRGLLYVLFPIHSYRGTLKFRELIPGKTLHCSGTMVRFFGTVPPGSHLHYFHYLYTLYLPSACSIHTLPLSYGKLMGGLRELSEPLCMFTHITTSPSDSSLLLCLTTQLAHM